MNNIENYRYKYNKYKYKYKYLSNKNYKGGSNCNIKYIEIINSTSIFDFIKNNLKDIDNNLINKAKYIINNFFKNKKQLIGGSSNSSYTSCIDTIINDFKNYIINMINKPCESVCLTNLCDYDYHEKECDCFCCITYPITISLSLIALIFYYIIILFIIILSIIPLSILYTIKIIINKPVSIAPEPQEMNTYTEPVSIGSTQLRESVSPPLQDIMEFGLSQEQIQEQERILNQFQQILRRNESEVSHKFEDKFILFLTSIISSNENAKNILISTIEDIFECSICYKDSGLLDKTACEHNFCYIFI